MPDRPLLTRSLSGAGVLMLTLSALSPVTSVFVTGAAIIRLAGTGAAVAVMAGGIVIPLPAFAGLIAVASFVVQSGLDACATAAAIETSGR